MSLSPNSPALNAKIKIKPTDHTAKNASYKKHNFIAFSNIRQQANNETPTH
jgi:hypothetical protein